MAIQEKPGGGNLLFTTGAGAPLLELDDSNAALKFGGTALAASATELNVLDGVTAGTITASKAVVVGSSKEVNEWTVTSGVLVQTQTVSTAALGTVRGVYGKVTSGVGGSATSGLLTGTRGEVNIASGDTIGGGVSLYGAQGKLIFAGTMNHADSRLTAHMAQLDISAGTYTTGQLSALWVDAGASASASAVSTKGGGQFNLIRITNTTSASSNAAVYFHGDADYLFDLSAPGGSADWYATAAGATAGANPYKIKINLGGVAKYILCADGWS